MDDDRTDDEPTPVCYRHRDRETLVSCSSCERPICTSCMTQAAVGVRCPDCAGKPVGAARLKPRAVARGTTYVTTGLVVANVVVFVLQMVTNPQSVGRGIGGSVSQEGWLRAIEVDGGEWYRIITSGFLHAGVGHLALNMIALWVLGKAFESYVGPLRFGVIYLSSVVWGAAGALVTADAFTPTVGASGGVFGLAAAIFIVERQRGVRIIGDAGVFLAINLAITFLLPNISIGGHLGGIVGGALAAVVLSRFGRGHIAARTTTPATLGLVGVVVLVGAVAAIVIGSARAESVSAHSAAAVATVQTATVSSWHPSG